MPIYIWQTHHTYPESLVGVHDRGITPDPYIFKRGSIVGPLLKRPVFRVASPARRLRAVTDISNTIGVPLVNEAISAVLTGAAPDDVELIEATVLASDEEIPGYRILNAIHKVSAIDRGVSDFHYVRGTSSIMAFRKLRLLESCLGEYEMARNQEYLPHLLISNRLRDRLNQASARPLGLYLAEELWP